MKSQKGFTLIELVTSFAVIAVLAIFAIAVINPLEQFKKTNDARRKSDLAQIQRALEVYYQDHGKYPSGDTNTNYKIQVLPGPETINWGDAWTPYINILPEDGGSKRYVYLSLSNNQMYKLYASLERGGKDLQACKVSESGCQTDPMGSACECQMLGAPDPKPKCGTGGNDYCTYGVSSPNTAP